MSVKSPRLAATPPRSRRSLIGGLLTLLVVTAAMGVFADVGNGLDGSLGLVAELGLPWVVLAILWGMRASSAIVGGFLGAGGIVLGLAGYVAFKVLQYGPSSVDQFLRHEAAMWLVLACLLGGPAGMAGAGAAHVGLRRELALGMVVGVACGEAVVWWGVVNGPGGAPAIAWPVIRGEIGAGLVIAVAVLALRMVRPVPFLMSAAAWTLISVLGGYAVYHMPY